MRSHIHTHTQVELHKFVANLLMRVRQDSSLRAINLFSANRDVLQHRMMLFARFLGFWVSNPLDPQKIYDPIGPGGLQVYLTTLVRVREGQCPLLEPGVKSYKVRFDEFCAATDMVLAEVKFHEREAIKTEIADMNGKDDLIELEVRLTHAHARLHTHLHTHAYTHTLIHTRLHTHAYTHTYTQTDTDALKRTQKHKMYDLYLLVISAFSYL